MTEKYYIVVISCVDWYDILDFAGVVKASSPEEAAQKAFKTRDHPQTSNDTVRVWGGFDQEPTEY